MSTAKIDKDAEVDESWLEDYIRFVLRPIAKRFNTTVRKVQVAPSKRKGFHILAALDKELSPNTLNEFQWLAGDDAQRVSMNKARISVGLQEWNKLWVEPNTRYRTVYHSGRRKCKK